MSQNKIASSLREINQYLDWLKDQLSELRRYGIDTDKIATPPRIYLRGVFRGFDTDTQTLCIEIDFEKNYYPLRYYDGAWLPMPGQQVLITRAQKDSRFGSQPTPEPESTTLDEAEDRAPRIIAFGNQGMVIPTAQIETFRVHGLELNGRDLRLIGSDREVRRLKLPENFEEIYGTDLRVGRTFGFSVIHAPPKRYYIPMGVSKNQTMETTENA